MLVTKGHNSIKKQIWSCGSHFLHISSDDAVYLNLFFRSQITSAILIHRRRERGGGQGAAPPPIILEGGQHTLWSPIIHPHFPSMSM